MESDNNEAFLCSICLDWPNHPCILLTCGHLFCFECLEKNKSHQCPICRKKYRKEDIFILAYGNQDGDINQNIGKYKNIQNKQEQVNKNINNDKNQRNVKRRKIKNYVNKVGHYINPFTYVNWVIGETQETILHAQRIVRQHKIQKQLDKEQIRQNINNQ